MLFAGDFIASFRFNIKIPFIYVELRIDKNLDDRFIDVRRIKTANSAFSEVLLRNILLNIDLSSEIHLQNELNGHLRFFCILKSGP